MRRLLAFVTAIALLLPFSGFAQAGNGGSGGTAAGPHAFGRFLIGEYGGDPIGWVTIDVRPADESTGPAAPGTFRFDALPDASGYPITTRSAIGWVDFYYETQCCDFPDVVVIFGVECQYLGGPDNLCRDFVAGFYDVGPGTNGDFFRWGPTGEEMTEFWVGSGDLTVNPGPDARETGG